ncbi:hypothetical protein TNCV_563161 [Trichonephila clavipes]|nr:hypothetical protein TNCV_563161 [Trichonephila clavipes]
MPNHPDWFADMAPYDITFPQNCSGTKDNWLRCPSWRCRSRSKLRGLSLNTLVWLLVMVKDSQPLGHEWRFVKVHGGGCSFRCHSDPFTVVQNYEVRHQ